VLDAISTSDAPFPWKALLSALALLSVALLPIALVYPQPDLRIGSNLYPSDILLLLSFASGNSAWFLCKFFAPPVTRLFGIGMLVGVVSGLLCVFFVYFAYGFAVHV
jgi:hypothetical protein